MGNTRNGTARDKDTYVICSWLGPFSSASTQVIDITLLGTVTIVITLAPATILMEGASSTANIAAVAATNAANETARDIEQLAARTMALAAESLNYKLSNIVLSIDCYHMDSSFYSAQANVLSSGSVYKLYTLILF